MNKLKGENKQLFADRIENAIYAFSLTVNKEGGLEHTQWFDSDLLIRAFVDMMAKDEQLSRVVITSAVIDMVKDPVKMKAVLETIKEALELKQKLEEEEKDED